MRSTWEAFYKARGRFYLTPHEKILSVISRFETYKVKNVLDLGCGSGRHSIALAKEGFKVTGVDYSKRALELAKKWAKSESLKIKFLQKDIFKKLPFRDNSFEGVLAIDSLHYESTEDLKKALKEVQRVLKDGGLLFVTLPTQINNPLVTHLVFTEKEIEELVSSTFKILETSFDKEKFLCVLGIKK